MRGRAGAAAGGMNLGASSISARRAKALAAKKAETEKEIQPPSPFKTIFEIGFPLPGEPNYKFRRYWIYISDWIRWNITNQHLFNGFIMFLIFTNCIFLAIEYPALDKESTMGQVLKIADFFYNLLFTIEVALKWAALGFWGQFEEVYGPQEWYRNKYVGYFNDKFNILDFVIVLGGWFSMGAANVSALRVLRVLRPLRNVSHIPKLKQIVSTVFDSLDGLLYVVLLLAFMLLVFGIIGLQLFEGVLHSQCFAVQYCPTPDYCVPIFKDSTASRALIESLDEDQLAQVQPDGPVTCYKNSMCGPGYICDHYGANPDGEVSSFDNIGFSVLNCFVSITLDWATLMFQVMDGFGSPYIWPFFYFLTFLVSFFALNLVLAVVCNAFDEEAQKQFPPGVDDLVLRPDPRVPQEEFKKLCARLTERKLLMMKDDFTEEEINLRKKMLKKHEDKVGDRKGYRRTRSKIGLKFVDNAVDPEEQDDPKDVDVYLAQVALELTRPTHISDHVRMKQFFHNYQIGRYDNVYVKVPKKGPIDNFKDGLVDSDFDILSGKPVNVKNIVLYNKETHQMMKYHGTLRGDVLSAQQLEEQDFVAWAHVQWPHEGWIELHKLKKLSRQNIDPKNKEFQQKIKDIRLAKHEFDSNYRSVFIKYNYDLAVDELFNNFIMSIILCNALTMSMEWDGIEDVYLFGGNTSLPDFLEIVNLAFGVIFVIEMIIKHIGFGLEGYWSDSWNSFDGTIVIISVFEFILQNAMGGNTGGLSALRAFRLFRVLRVLRLLNQFDQLRRQLKSIMASVSSVIWLLFLLMLFLFTFGILGTSLFGGTGPLDLYGDRYSWENLYYSMLTVFQCITGDSWRSVQADTANATGTAVVSLYFVLVMVLGSFMLLNIFIAILLTNMTEPVDKRLSDLEDMMQWAEAEHTYFKNELDKEDEKKLRILCRLWLQRQQVSWVKSRHPYFKHRAKHIAMGNSLGIFPVDHPLRVAIHGLVHKDWFGNFIDFAIFLNCMFLALEDAKTAEEGTDSTLGQIIAITDIIFTILFILEMVLKVFAHGFQEEPYGQTREWEKFRIPPFASYNIHNGEKFKKGQFEELLMDWKPEIRRGFQAASPWQFRCQKDAVTMLRDDAYIESVDMTSMWLTKWKHDNWTFGVNPENPFGRGDKQLDFEGELDLNKGYIYDMVWTAAHQAAGNKSDRSLMVIHFIIESAPDKDNGRFEVRFCYDVTDDLLDGDVHKAPDRAKLILRYWTFDMKKTRGWLFWDADGLLSDKAGGRRDVEEEKDQELLQILQSIDLDNKCTTAYWTDNWNKLDATVVFFSVIALILPSVKPLRALRAVRPLRLAIRVPAIKVVVSTLVSAIRPAVFALVFCFFLFYILAILGVNLFVGKFKQCTGTDDFGNDIDVYKYNEEECSLLSNFYGWDVRWHNYPFNFDNIGKGLIAVFVIASGDTWHAIMYRGMDAPQEAGGKPTLNGSWYYGIYFVAVMILAGFFSFNFVVSAIVDKFIEVQGVKDGSAFATPAQAAWQKARRVRDKFTLERIPPCPSKSPVREFCYHVVNWGPKNRTFDNAITACILLNTFFMMLAHYEMNDTFADVLRIADYLFIAIFTLEAVLKIIAYNFTVYWQNGWNQFDFVVVILSYPGLFYTDGPSTNVFRVFRIGRILRLIKKARQLELLFSTLIYSLPSLRNVGLLLFIFYFIFAVIGVSLFGDVEDPEGRVSPRHRNWSNWPEAMNLLYIGSTGDSWTTPWQGLMYHSSSPAMADFYNLLFFVLLGLVMLNLFIGVILDTYDQNDKINQAEDKMLAVHRFTKLWNHCDHLTIGHLPVENLLGILKVTPWPIGFSKPLRVEHEDNMKLLKYEKNFERTRKRLESMARAQKRRGGQEVFEEPTKEEVFSHISRYSIECKRWRKQGVWVCNFDQVIIAFATVLLHFDVEEEKHTSRYYRWLRVHFQDQTEELYEACLLGMKARNANLGDRFLDYEPDPETDEEDEEEEQAMHIHREQASE